MKKIAIACDHAGFEYKEKLVEYFRSLGHEVKDFGCHSEDSMDYPDTAHPLAYAIEKEEFELGFTICGSGNGISMTANKHQGVRCALCWEVEISSLARQHNNANVCGMPARFISYDKAKAIADAFLNTDFEGGRHQNRVNKIAIK
jgi:ribose 5-phosphate isomerase B